MHLHRGDGEKYGVREKEHKRDVKPQEKKYTRSRKKDSLTELHPSTIMDHVENHTIYWEGVKFPARDTDWPARGMKEAIEIRKTGATQ